MAKAVARMLRTTIMPARRDRIRQDVADISSPGELLRYALAGQLERLKRRGYNHGEIAMGAGFGTSPRNAGPALATALRYGPKADQLHRLDEVIGTLDQRMDGTGGLSSLALRLSEDRRDTIKSSLLAARVPARWTTQVLADPPGGEVGVLLQASAVLSEFMAVGKMRSDAIATIRDRYETDLELLVRRLSLMAVSPPTASSYDAQVLLGMLASYVFEPLRDRLDSQLRHSPMSFRVWRVVTKLVKLSQDGEHAKDLKAWVRQLMRDADGLRKYSLYAGRSLDLELAITVPPTWSLPDDDWVSQALLTRARNPEATIRERGTAAMGLWQRALRYGSPSPKMTRENLRELITEFRDDPGSRPDAPAGLRWLAATLEHVIDRNVEVCNDWPDVDEGWFRNVQAAADELDGAGLPPHLVTGTKNLFRHMILQNAGVHRRDAIETVVTSGWSAPVARALGSLLEKEEEAWVRIRAEFALSFLQQHDATVESDLMRACKHAYARLELDKTPEDQAPPRSYVTEMQCSLFAVGDCFGVPGCEERARSMRTTLAPILTRLSDMEGDRALMLRRPARAAAYLLAMTAQPEYSGKQDLSRVLLEKLSQHPDPTTAKLSSWALSFRFGPDGTVRPLLAAVEHGQPDDIP
jgi:hypothetical protein